MLRLATQPLAEAALSEGEREIWDRLAEGPRRRDWLLGRAALRQLLGGADTSPVTFPHPNLSLTHAAGVAVAAGSRGSCIGLGVDFEGCRTTDPRTARFYLSQREQDRMETGDDPLRIWTIKEALYKATPDNAEGGLLDYELAEPAATRGTACDRRSNAFRYVSGFFRRGWLAVAICIGAADAAL